MLLKHDGLCGTCGFGALPWPSTDVLKVIQLCIIWINLGQHFILLWARKGPYIILLSHAALDCYGRLAYILHRNICPVNQEMNEKSLGRILYHLKFTSRLFCEYNFSNYRSMINNSSHIIFNLLIKPTFHLVCVHIYFPHAVSSMNTGQKIQCNFVLWSLINLPWNTLMNCLLRYSDFSIYFMVPGLVHDQKLEGKKFQRKNNSSWYQTHD